MDKKDNFLVAQFGKTVGLKGELRLNLHTDFPEQFRVGRVLKTQRGNLEIESYNPKRGLIKIVGYNNPEDAKKLTNTKIFSTIEETKEFCKLNEGEYFWFDLIGCKVFEKNILVGTIQEIQRLPQCDYFLIETSNSLIQNKKSKTFLLPYLPNFVDSVDINNRKISVVGAIDILDAS